MPTKNNRSGIEPQQDRGSIEGKGQQTVAGKLAEICPFRGCLRRAPIRMRDNK
ncbi:unnamed protein product [Tenebrio molitor]|nr:unnamed protein product [Tenebrio molitor]